MRTGRTKHRDQIFMPAAIRSCTIPCHEALARSFVLLTVRDLDFIVHRVPSIPGRNYVCSRSSITPSLAFSPPQARGGKLHAKLQIRSNLEHEGITESRVKIRE